MDSVYGVLALLSVAAIWWLWQRRRYFKVLHSEGLPGPQPGLLLGNLLEYRYGEKPCHLVLEDWIQEYGKLYGFHRGVERYVVVHDLDILREVLIKDFRNYAWRPPMSFSTDDFSNSVLEVSSYSRWKVMRTHMVSCFSVVKMKQMWPLVNQCVDTTVQLLHEAAASSPASIDVHNLFQGLSCDMISSCALALKTNCQRDPNDAFLHRLRFFLANASHPITEGASAFPTIAKIVFPFMKVFGNNELMVKMIMDNLQEVMKQRRADPHVRYQDILQVMLDADESSERCSKSELMLTDSEIRGNALVMLLAGFDTTANSLTFTAYLLAKHPDIQQRLYEEIVEHVGPGRQPLYDQLCSLEYLDQVVCESLRFYPPLVTFVSRHSSQPTRLGDYQLPAGVNVVAPVWSIHHDPDVWPEPELFDPDRFSAEQKAAGRHPMAWLPFGAGPRNCLGMRFGLLAFKLTLVRILQRFRLEMTDETPKDLSVKVPTVTLCVDGQMIIGVVERISTTAE